MSFAEVGFSTNWSYGGRKNIATRFTLINRPLANVLPRLAAITCIAIITNFGILAGKTAVSRRHDFEPVYWLVVLKIRPTTIQKRLSEGFHVWLI